MNKPNSRRRYYEQQHLKQMKNKQVVNALLLILATVCCTIAIMLPFVTTKKTQPLPPPITPIDNTPPQEDPWKAFTKHMETCPQCSSKDPDGGPAQMCLVAFLLLGDAVEWEKANGRDPWKESQN